MNRIISMISLTLLTTILAGCPDECDSADTDCDSGTGSDSGTGGTDTGTSVPGETGTLEVLALVNGAVVDSRVSYRGPENGTYETATQPSATVQTGTYTVSVGVGTSACGGVPCHTMPDGTVRVTPKQVAEVRKNATTTIEAPLAVYLSGPQRWACTHTGYRYDPNAPDFKGEADGFFSEDQTQLVEVVDGARIEAHTDPNFHLLEDDDYLEVRNDAMHGDHLVLVEPTDDGYHAFVSASSVSAIRFTFTYVIEYNTGAGVTVVDCIKRP